MIGAGAFRREQQEHEIDFLAVQGVEIDRLGQTSEHADNTPHAGKLGVRDGDAMLEPGRAQPLTLPQRIENIAFGKSGEASGPSRQLLQELFLGLDLERGDHSLRRDEMTYM